MNFDFDCTVIGAGVVGLAIARELALKGHSVLILEKEEMFGSHTSSRNSEVIHAGIYYPIDSLKGKFCLLGRDLLYQYCTQFNISHNRIGKFIVATKDSQFATLESLQFKSHKSGAGSLEWYSKREMTALEPALQCTGALFSPMTGIIDSHEYMMSLLGMAENNGAKLSTNSTVVNIEALHEGFDLFVDCGEAELFRLKTRAVINSAGLYAWDVVSSLYKQISKELPRRYYAKGTYFNYTKKAPFSHLIYPVPVDGGLGTHVTLDMGGSMRFGPDVEWVNTIDYSINEKRKNSFIESIKHYFPDIAEEDISVAFSGIRPKTMPSGKENDFLIEDLAENGVPNLITLFGIESPGLTSSLALAEYVVEKIHL